MGAASAMHSTTLPLPSDLRWRRILAVGLFLGLLYAFRKLAPVFVCFVVIERSLGALAGLLERRAGVRRPHSLLVVLLLLVGGAAIGGILGARRLLPLAVSRWDEAPRYAESVLAQPAIVALQGWTGASASSLLETVKAHALTALSYATAAAHLVVYLLVGALLALIFLFEQDELRRWSGEMRKDSPARTMLRYLGYAADAVFVTVRMQAVVAVVNAVITLPVLLLLGLPNVPLLFAFILATGLVPVVGNVISGVVLSAVAYATHGAWAVGVFLAATFVLHKIESYYLNPRLAAEHVKLPGLVLVVSLLLFEQLFGFWGLFLSFPALYVGTRIAHEWGEDAAQRAPAPGAG